MNRLDRLILYATLGTLLLADALLVLLILRLGAGQ